MKRKIKLFTTAVMTAFFLFIAFASGNKKKEINIDSIDEIKEFISGKWHDETVESGGVITYYRFEITSQEIKNHPNTLFFKDFYSAYCHASEAKSEIWVIGGSKIY